MKTCYVHGIVFVISISDKVKFCTSEAVGNQTSDVLVGALRKIQATYLRCGFQISIVSLDGEFSGAWEWIREEALMEVNLVATGEHAPVIERPIRHLKEGAIGMY